MSRRTITISSILLAVVGGLSSCVQSPSNECTAIPREQAVSIADAAKEGMLSRSTTAVEQNFAESSAQVRALNDGRGYGAQVSYRGDDGQTLTALIHEDCYVGWTE